MRAFCLTTLFIVISCSSLFSQKVTKKILTLNTTGFLKQNFSSDIPVFPYLYNDSISDEKLLATLDRLPVFYTKPYYVLYENDSTKYAVTLFRNNFIFNYYSIIHYSKNGYILSTLRYNKKHLKTNVFFDYFPGYRMKTYGSYRNGNKKGKWKYFDENGKLIKKETYRNGKLKRSKELKHPHRTYFTLFAGPEAVAYKISDPADNTSKINFSSKDISDYDFIRGFGNFAFSENFMNLAGLRNNRYMLGLPADNAFGYGIGFNVGDRRKFFANINVALGSSKGKNGTTSVSVGNTIVTYPLNVSNNFFRWNFVANYPILGRLKRTTLFIFCGTEFASMFPTSETVSSNGQSTSYYVAAKINQNWLVNTGLMIDKIIGKGKQGFFTSVFIKAGYNFSTMPPVWYDNTSTQKPKLTTLPLYQGLPYINMGGFYVTAGVSCWRGKNKKVKTE